VAFGVGAVTSSAPPRPLDLSAAGGLGLPCAGSVTPWGTLLSSEEFETDAAKAQPDGRDPGDHAGWNRQVGYWADGSKPETYRYGWIPELGPFPALAGGAGPVAVPGGKRTAMGRLSHEQALLMPDGRTVYMSDDGNNGVLTMFVADKAGDLRAGHLYAARLEGLPQAPGQPPGRVSWVPLGHATEAEVNAALARPPAFADLLRRAEVGGEGQCPSGLRPVNTAWGAECLMVQPGKEVLASRLETRRFAALRGATTELTKAEGLALDVTRQRVLLAITAVKGGMEAAHPTWDKAGPDHVRLTPNRCGGVLSLDAAPGQVDAAGAPIDSPWAAATVGWLLQGRPAETGCDLEGIAGPDNISVWPEGDQLFIAEDTREHPNAALWAYDLRTGALHRLATAPTKSELAGLQLSVDPLGQTWLSLSVQFDTEADGTSQSGLLGPLTPPAAAP
jgi:secreted PhoX family phosphatase